MNISVNHSNNLLIVGERRLSLDKFRSFILHRWHPLARAYAIRPVISQGDVLYTFDWARIFTIAVNGGVIVGEFLEQEGIIG